MARANRIFGPQRLARTTEHSGQILTARARLDEASRAGQRGRVRAAKRTTLLELELVADDSWAWDVRADRLLEAVMVPILLHHNDAIRAGRKADGSGAQPALRFQAARDPDRRSKHRGFDSGFFADTLFMSRITGSTRTANVTIRPNRERGDWLSNEAERGNEYLFVTGAVEALIVEKVAEWFDGAVEARAGEPDLSERTAAAAR